MLWSVSQMRSTTKSTSGPGSGFGPVQQMEKLIDERVVAGQRKPLEGQSRDRRTDRAVESGFDPIDE